MIKWCGIDSATADGKINQGDLIENDENTLLN